MSNKPGEEWAVKKPRMVSVTVSVSEECLERYSRLARKTHRSRALYLRMAINSFLPELERRYADQVLTDRAEQQRVALNLEFSRIIGGIDEEASADRPGTTGWQAEPGNLWDFSRKDPPF